MIQRLGRYPGQPPRTIDHGPVSIDMRSVALGGVRMADAIGTAPGRAPAARRAAGLSAGAHVVARLGDWGVECSCGWQSGSDIEREWRFHRAAMGLRTTGG